MLEINLQWLNEKLDDIRTDIQSLHQVNGRLKSIEYIGWFIVGMLFAHIVRHW